MMYFRAMRQRAESCWSVRTNFVVSRIVKFGPRVTRRFNQLFIGSALEINSRKSFRCLALFLLVLFLQPLSPILLRAQVDRTAITGTVTDQQGNRVPAMPECAPPRVRQAFSGRR